MHFLPSACYHSRPSEPARPLDLGPTQRRTPYLSSASTVWMSSSSTCESDLWRMVDRHDATSWLEHEETNEDPDNYRRRNHQPIAHGEVLPIVD